MSNDYVEETTSLICGVEGQQLIPHVIRLLAEGTPVDIERLASASGLPVNTVEDLLRDQVSAERDDDGRVVGFVLSLRETPHRYTTRGPTFYAWCATDTLMLPVILGEPAVVESTCPETGESIRIELTPEGVAAVEPRETVLSAVRPKDGCDDVRAQTCALGHFFSSREAAAGWAAAHPEGFVHSVEEEFELDREVMRRLGWEAVHEPAKQC